MRSHLFKTIYRHPKFNGYGKDLAYKRFSILNDLKFQSILDVGSGPCFLQTWLIENNINSEYEAVDIREECFKLCNCNTYKNIPSHRLYDMVCLFGTVTYNINNDENENKKILKDLLFKSKAVSNSFLLFTVFKESIRKKHVDINPKNFFVYFHEDEIKNMLNSIGIFNYQIIENDKLDELEYFIICKLDSHSS